MRPDSELIWPGYYRRSKRASRHTVTITATHGGLSISKSNGETLYWPYTEARLRQRRHKDQNRLRLERGAKDDYEVLVIEDYSALGTIRAYAPGFGRSSMVRRLIPYAAGLAVLATLPWVYAAGIGPVIELATRFVPIEWEEQIGSNVVAGIIPAPQLCTGEEMYNTVQGVLSAVTKHVENSRYRLRLAISDDVRFFSCAVPGGYLVLYHGLIADTKSPEELAGLLAHEAAHVFAGHARRIALGELALPGLIALTVGAGRSEVGEKSEQMGTLSFSEDDEEEADAMAMQMLLDAHIDPQPAVNLYESLETRPDSLLGASIYVSAHPRVPGSAERLRRMAAAANKFQPVTLPGGNHWKLVTLGCFARGSK